MHRIFDIAMTVVGAAAAISAAGCSTNEVADARDAAPIEGGAGPSTEPDAGSAAANPCNCDVQDGVLVMSWQCFCTTYAIGGCDMTLPSQAVCEQSNLSRTDYPGCGLTVLDTPSIGPIRQVYDRTGTLVGEQITADLGTYGCPSWPSGPGFVSVRAGGFPDASCGGIECPQGSCGPCRGDASAN